MSHYSDEREKSIVDMLKQSGIGDAGISTERWDTVNYPKHYNSDKSGVEPIQITQHMSFCLGNVIKYVMRAKHKGKELEDLQKALWYLNKEIERLKNDNNSI